MGASPELTSVSDLQYFHRNYISGRFTGMYVSERITPIGIAIDGGTGIAVRALTIFSYLKHRREKFLWCFTNLSLLLKFTLGIYVRERQNSRHSEPNNPDSTALRIVSVKTSFSLLFSYITGI